jgi:hypothetical protein
MRAYENVVADFYWAEEPDERSDLNPVPDRRVSLPLRVSGYSCCSQCHTAKQVAVVANTRRFPNDRAKSMIENEAPTDLAVRMNFCSG